MPKFNETYCSQCGGAFGPGDHGYSRCDHHKGLTNLDEQAIGGQTLDEQIKTIITKLRAGCIMQWTGDGSDNREVNIKDTNAVMADIAVILQAIFDPENQPSQFGTLLTKG
jgi:hypothetical protein